jgi:hypothetical protein
VLQSTIQSIRSQWTTIIPATTLLLVSFTLPAQAQTDNTTAQAKQNFQNATAAIAKSDWQTAKSELLQAEKLAPQNALVHYDLALAYSHTGQVKSKQSELNRALKLGLPVEQKMDAEKLSQHLAASAKSQAIHKPAQPNSSSDISWFVSYDKYKAISVSGVTLRNIARTNPNYYMKIVSIWDSAQQQNEPSTFNDTLLLFGSSPDELDEKPAQKEGILLLDGKERLFLTGSEQCKAIDCTSASHHLAGGIYAMMIKDLASANTIEGLVDGVEIVLKPEHIAALSEFATSRKLIFLGDRLQSKFHRETAVEAAAGLTNAIAAGSPLSFQGDFLEARNQKIVHLNQDEFVMSYNVLTKDGMLPTVEAGEVLKDIYVMEPYYLYCITSKDCVKRTVSLHSKTGKQTFSNAWNKFEQPILAAHMDALAYIYYRIMFWGDGLVFYPK